MKQISMYRVVDLLKEMQWERYVEKETSGVRKKPRKSEKPLKLKMWRDREIRKNSWGIEINEKAVRARPFKR